MERKFLEGLGIEKPMIEQIMAEHGKSVQAVNGRLDILKAEQDGKYKSTVQGCINNLLRSYLKGKVHDVDVAVSLIDTEIDGENEDELADFGSRIEKLEFDKPFLFIKQEEKAGVSIVGVKPFESERGQGGKPVNVSLAQAVEAAYSNK